MNNIKNDNDQVESDRLDNNPHGNGDTGIFVRLTGFLGTVVVVAALARWASRRPR